MRLRRWRTAKKPYYAKRAAMRQQLEDPAIQPLKAIDAAKDDVICRVCPTFYTHGSSAICGPFSRKSAMSRERYFIA